jgi:Copper binding proteins, plastocyanin/azurin family
VFPFPTFPRSPSRWRPRRSSFAIVVPLIVASFALVAGCSSSGSSSGTSGSGGGGGSGSGGGTKVTATETEFHIALSASTFSPGKYTFTAVNKGQLDHSLVINGPGVNKIQTQGLVAPGQSGSVTVTLSKGTYDIYCGVPGHKQEGMDVHIKVS